SIASDAAPIKFALLPPPLVDDSPLAGRDDEVQVHIPLNVSGLANSSIARLQGHLITIEDPNGFRWSPGWKGQNDNLFTNNSEVILNFQLPHKVYERIRRAPVRVRVSLAVVMLRDTDPKKFNTPEANF